MVRCKYECEKAEREIKSNLHILIIMVKYSVSVYKLDCTGHNTYVTILWKRGEGLCFMKWKEAG